MNLGIPYAELTLYLQGKSIPGDDVLLRAVEIILDELPGIRRTTSPEVWEALRLPD